MNKMTDMGKKMEKPQVEPVPSTKDDVSYPHLYIDSDQMPDLKGVEVGDEIVLTVKAKVTGVRSEEHDGKSCTYYDIDLMEGMMEGAKQSKDNEDISGMMGKKKDKMSEMIGEAEDNKELDKEEE
jgi:hypothetical protein